VLEVLICVPADVRVDENRKVPLLAAFGDGPGFAAGLFIALGGQAKLYHFDSVVRRAIALRRVEGEGERGGEGEGGGELSKEFLTFLKFGNAVCPAMAAADRITAPSKD
jgi:hypothetical protein